MSACPLSPARRPVTDTGCLTHREAFTLDTARVLAPADSSHRHASPTHGVARATPKRMSRLLAIFAFLAGGFAAELAHPVQCELLTPARVQVQRRKS